MSLLKENCGDGVLKSENKKRTPQNTDVLVEHLRVAEHALKVLDLADVPGACAGDAMSRVDGVLTGDVGAS